MFNFIADQIKSLFGKGKLRIEFVACDDKTGVITGSFIGSFDDGLRDHLKDLANQIFVKDGVMVKKMRVIGMEGRGCPDLDDRWFEVYWKNFKAIGVV